MSNELEIQQSMGKEETKERSDKEKKKKKKKKKEKEEDKKKKKNLRYAAGITNYLFPLKLLGEVWEDPNLEEWPENDYRIFVQNLGNEVTDEMLALAFRKYQSFNKARVICQFFFLNTR